MPSRHDGSTARAGKRAAARPAASTPITGTGASASPGDRVFIGKDILELLSSAMYTDPLTIYREYVQNSADAIEARRLDGPRGRGRVDIRIDHDARSVRITDDGTSIPVSEAPRSLLRSEEPTSELQSLMRNSYAASCFKKK